MSDLDERLKKGLALRDRLSAESQRVQGRKDAADKALAAVEDEIRSKNLSPDTLQDTLDTLGVAYEKEVASFEAALATAHTALSPYLENDA
jgi:hypothetical protein